MSDAGRETTSRQFLASFADSVSAWAKVNCVSKPPAGKIALIVELARIGHPFVDQHEAGTVFDEQLAQHVARAGRLLVVLRDPRECLRAAELVGELAP